MQRQPGAPVKEFGRRQVRPAQRAAASERVRAARVVPGAVGLNTREFLKPGATAYLGKATPQARQRFATVLAVTGGVLYGAAIAPHATSGVGDVSRAVVTAADLSATVVRPFVDHVAGVADQLQRDVARGSVAVVDAAGRAVRSATASIDAAPGAVVEQVGRGWDEARNGIDEAGHRVRGSLQDWVDGQVAEMKASAGMIREGLSPAVGRLAELAVKSVDMISQDMEREAKLAEIERTGVVVDIPGYKAYADLDTHAEQVSQTMAALVDGVEKKIMARTAAPAPVSFQMADARHSVPSVSGIGALTKRAAYRVDGDQVTIGGSKIRTDVVSSIAHAARITGEDPVYLAALAGRESAFKPHDKASTSSATGLFQFIRETWLSAMKQFGAKLGLGSVSDEIKPTRRGYVVANPARKAAILAMREDPLVSGLVVSEMARNDRVVLEQALGRPATAGERYMPHFLGIAEAVRMVSLARQHPSAPAADYFRKAASANHSLFYAKNGAKYSVAQVIGGFKNWFDGPNGGMQRYAAFAHAAESVPVPVSPQYAALSKAAASRVEHAPASKPAGRSAPMATPAPVAHPVQTVSLQTATPVEVKPVARTEPPEAEIRIDEASLPPATIQVRTPIRPGREASWKIGAGRIAQYVDASGKLGAWATSFGRSDIISGFGSNFARLPRAIQEHLQNASQLNLNVLAPYAKFMPAAMREGFANEGLTFQDSVPPSGGELVTVPNPKYEPARREAIAAARAAARQAAASVMAPPTLPSVEERSPGVKVASLRSGEEVAGRAVQESRPSMTSPVIPPIPSGLDRPLKPAEETATVAIDFAPAEGKSEPALPPGRRMTDEEVRTMVADVLSPRIRVRRQHAPQAPQPDEHPTTTMISLPRGLFGP